MITGRFRQIIVRAIGKMKESKDLLISLSSLIVAISSCVVSCNTSRLSNRMQKQQLLANEMEHQPVFSAHTTLSQNDEGVYAWEEFEILNNGDRVAQIISIDEWTFFELDYRIKQEQQIKNAFFYVDDYFCFKRFTYNLQGLVFKSFGANYCDNFMKFNHIYEDAMACSQYQSGRFTAVEVLHYFCVMYQDIYGKDKVIYLTNDGPTTKEELDRVLAIVEEYRGVVPSKLDSITFGAMLSTIAEGKMEN